MFIDNPGATTPGSDLLDASRFDFTVESLTAMDVHLEKVRQIALSPGDRLIFVLRSGAYVGEVIRRFTPLPREWHWLSYKQAADILPVVASLGVSIETSAILWDGKEGAIRPLAKVSKYLQNGGEDSVLFYAQVVIAGPPTMVPGMPFLG